MGYQCKFTNLPVGRNTNALSNCRPTIHIIVVSPLVCFLVAGHLSYRCTTTAAIFLSSLLYLWFYSFSANLIVSLHELTISGNRSSLILILVPSHRIQPFTILPTEEASVRMYYLGSFNLSVWYALKKSVRHLQLQYRMYDN